MGHSQAQRDEELVAALGLDGALVISDVVYQALPDHRRHLVPMPNGAGYVRLQLADPPEVAALRQIAEYGIAANMQSDDGYTAARQMQRIALDAVAAWESGASRA
jgi:hypothetical protein